MATFPACVPYNPWSNPALSQNKYYLISQRRLQLELAKILCKDPPNTALELRPEFCNHQPAELSAQPQLRLQMGNEWSVDSSVFTNNNI